MTEPDIQFLFLHNRERFQNALWRRAWWLEPDQKQVLVNQLYVLIMSNWQKFRWEQPEINVRDKGLNKAFVKWASVHFYNKPNALRTLLDGIGVEWRGTAAEFENDWPDPDEQEWDRSIMI